MNLLVVLADSVGAICHPQLHPADALIVLLRIAIKHGGPRVTAMRPIERLAIVDKQLLRFLIDDLILVHKPPSALLAELLSFNAAVLLPDFHLLELLGLARPHSGDDIVADLDTVFADQPQREARQFRMQGGGQRLGRGKLSANGRLDLHVVLAQRADEVDGAGVEHELLEHGRGVGGLANELAGGHAELRQPFRRSDAAERVRHHGERRLERRSRLEAQRVKDTIARRRRGPRPVGRPRAKRIDVRDVARWVMRALANLAVVTLSAVRTPHRHPWVDAIARAHTCLPQIVACGQPTRHAICLLTRLLPRPPMGASPHA